MLYYNSVDPNDEIIPDCDLVFIVGNVGHVRRSMLYAETLCSKYPKTKFVFNMGRTEGVNIKNNNQLVDGLRTRQLLSPLWPKNLHYAHRESLILTINETTIDILCLHGYPHVDASVEDNAVWRSHNWYKFSPHGVTYNQNDFKVSGAADVYHGWFPEITTPELCRRDHDKDAVLVNEWLSNRENGIPKVLVSAFSPITDLCMPGVEYTMYLGANPNYWIFGGTKSNTIAENGTVLYGNPGRGLDTRGEILTIDVT
jgi:hypothetical protein